MTRRQRSRSELHEWIAQHNEAALLAAGFEDAIVGVAERCSQPPLVVYDVQRCLKILMERDGMDAEGALECFEYNVLGAWLGDNTPLFLWTYEGPPAVNGEG
jgi:hypothetical protein